MAELAVASAQLAFSTLSPIFKKLCKYAYDSNFGGDVTAEEMKHLNDFVRFKIMALIREAELDPSDKLGPLLENLQAAAFEAEDLLDLYEYDQIKYQYCTYLEIKKCPMLMRDEALLVEGDIIRPLSQIEEITTDEPLLVLVLVQQQAFSPIKFLGLYGLERPFPPLLEDHFQQLSSLKTLILHHVTTLPNLEKLSSLKQLILVNCPDVELLPNLPISLTDIISPRGCPKLKVNYEEGGRLRHTISHIPWIYISSW